MTFKEFSKIIKEKRMRLNVTQKKMAELLYISQTKYNKIENGLREPDFELLQRILTLLLKFVIFLNLAIYLLKMLLFAKGVALFLM